LIENSGALTGEEYEALRSQFATLKPARGTHRKYLPYAFTEQGVAMLSSVLHREVEHEHAPRSRLFPTLTDHLYDVFSAWQKR
jgi:hypothetical protein